MTDDGLAGDQSGGDQPEGRIPKLARRGFIAAGVAGAGAALVVPSAVGAAPRARSQSARASAATAGIDLSPPVVDPSLQSLVAIPDGRIGAAVGALDEVVREVLSKTGIPGLAAAVVHRGDLLYAKGFGVRDVKTGAPVNARTVFRLASVSKPLSSTVVAGIVGRKLIEWGDPILGHLPGFALSDRYVTAHVSYADMFSHVSGLPGHAGDLLEGLGYNRSYILRALRLEKLASFRATYDYTNFGLTAAAVAAANAADSDWATIADTILFSPLGMAASSYRYSDFVRRSNRAAMHVRIGGKWFQKYTRNADPEAPAGGASSNVVDLARWMALKLANGRWRGKQLIDAEALLEVNSPRSVSGPPGSAASRAGFYGLGTNVAYDYSGRTRISHSGGFNQGVATNYHLLPDQQLGIVTLTNGMPIGAPEAINSYFLDLVVGGEIENDWLKLYSQVFAGLYINHSKLAGQTPPAHPRAARPASFYVGRYANPYYGPIRVVSRGSQLHVLIGPTPIDYPLRHWSGDVFAFFPVGEDAVGISAATFTPDSRRQRAKSLTLEYYDATGLGTFTSR